MGVRTRKFKQNPLLGRKQFVLDIIHPGLANVSKKDLAAKLASMYKVGLPVHHALRLQDRLRRRPQLWFRPHLREPGQNEEVRAKVSPRPRRLRQSRRQRTPW